MFDRSISVSRKSLDESPSGDSIFTVDTKKIMQRQLAVHSDLGAVELEVDVECASDSWRTIDVGGDLFVCAGSSLITRHNLFVAGNLEVRGGGLNVSHVLMLKKGGYTIRGSITARTIFSFGDLRVDGDLTVENSIVCEGSISCSGKLLVGGTIEAFEIRSADPEQVRSDNLLAKGTRIEPAR